MLALAVALGAGAAAADEPWRPLFVQDGVSVEEGTDPGSGLPDFRGQVELDADPYEILAVILDVPGQTAWMWKCRESRLLAREGDAVQIVYQRLAAPWPAKDRDVVLRGEARVVETGHLDVRFTSVEHAGAPPVPGRVRMPRLDGEFDLVALSPTRTRVTYTVAASPGGLLPRLVLRGAVRESPLVTLVGLRRRVSETRGRYADVVARWKGRAP